MNNSDIGYIDNDFRESIKYGSRGLTSIRWNRRQLFERR